MASSDLDPRIVEVLSVATEMKAAGTEGLIKTVPGLRHSHEMRVAQVLPDRCHIGVDMLFHGVLPLMRFFNFFGKMTP